MPPPMFSDRPKTLSTWPPRSCSLLRVRQKGQRGSDWDDERGRDGEGRGVGWWECRRRMPTELSHAAISGLLTQHHWSMTETNVVKRSGHKRTDSHTTPVSRGPLELLALFCQPDTK